MRADRLLSLVLLLRHRGRMTASELAAELECSTRTVQRDVDALSAAGVPVYAERGRTGGFALLPGYRTDLTGMTQSESVALLVAGGGDGQASRSLGMAPALAAAMRKVVAALPDAQRATAQAAADRVLLHPERMIRIPVPGIAAAEPDPSGAPFSEVQRGVFEGRRLRLTYRARDDGEPRTRTVDPLGLVDAAGHWYLLALRDGADRTYRLSRVSAAEVLDEPAARPDGVDLAALWERRRAGFAASMPTLTARVLVTDAGLLRVPDAGPGPHARRPVADGRTEVEIGFGGLGHAVHVLWGLGPDAEALDPPELRAALADRAAATARRYGR